jgi:Carboxypeptidase regulatory-like domain
MKKVISFVAMTLLMAACGGSPVQPTRAGSTPAPVPTATFSVGGTVFEATADGSRGIADATIKVGNDLQTLTASTDENGAFSLEGVKPGTWQLSVSKEGYETQTMTLDLQASQTVEVELRVVTN